MKKYLSSIIFWGAFWGLTEATLGYVLHTLSLGIGWIFWFPLAFYFISSVYRRTNSLSSIILTSFLAAAIKMIDFIMPTSPDRIINPAVSIILEGLAVFLLFTIIERKRNVNIDSSNDSNRDIGPGASHAGYPGVLSACIGWRVLYIAYMLLMPASYATISPLRSATALLSFLLVESITNCLVICVCMKVSESAGKKAGRSAGSMIKRLKIHSELNSVLEIAFSCLMLSAAILAQWAL